MGLNSRSGTLCSWNTYASFQSARSRAACLSCRTELCGSGFSGGGEFVTNLIKGSMNRREIAPHKKAWARYAVQFQVRCTFDSKENDENGTNTEQQSIPYHKDRQSPLNTSPPLS